MTRRLHNPPKRYRARRSRASDHYRRGGPDEWERDLLARAYGLYLDDRVDDQ